MEGMLSLFLFAFLFQSLHTHVYVVFRTQAQQLTQQPIADADSPIYALYAFFKTLGKFPLFTDPSPGYHGLKFWDVFGGEKVRVSNMCFLACRRSVVGHSL